MQSLPLKNVTFTTENVDQTFAQKYNICHASDSVLKPWLKHKHRYKIHMRHLHDIFVTTNIPHSSLHPAVMTFEIPIYPNPDLKSGCFLKLLSLQ